MNDSAGASALAAANGDAKVAIVSLLTGLLFLAYTLVVAYGFFARKKLADVPALLVAAGTFYMGVSSRRHVAVFVVLTLPIVALVIKDLRFRVARSVED